MAQGKFKKAKLPTNVQKKQKKKNGAAFTRRLNAPIQSKKNRFNENQRIKNAISKAVNKSVESELRSRAATGEINLSSAQKEVAKHHKNAAATATTSSAAASTSKNA